MTPLTPLMPAEVAERLKARKAILIDIRESDEFAREHVSGAVHAPLSRFDALAIVGAGLFFVGATGTSSMARLLAVMPWNRKALGGRVTS